MIVTSEKQLKDLIDSLKAELTGDLLKDCDIQAEIYHFKKELAKEQGITIEQYEDNDQEECLYCGS
jgi:hypothetical protein